MDTFNDCSGAQLNSQQGLLQRVFAPAQGSDRRSEIITCLVTVARAQRGLIRHLPDRDDAVDLRPVVTGLQGLIGDEILPKPCIDPQFGG